MAGDEAVRLVAAVRDVRRWLDHSINTGQYTPGLVGELARWSATRGYALHEVYDEISMLEGVNPRTSRTPPPRELPGSLRGLWRKDHHQPLFRAAGPTSEFVVFGRLAGGGNRYLTLGCDGEWDAIAARVGLGTSAGPFRRPRFGDPGGGAQL